MIRRPRRRFSAEEKARIVGLYQQSGLTRVEFCRREGVSRFNLQRWLGKRSRAGEARFVEVEARAIGKQGRYRFGFEGGHGWKSKEDLMSGKFGCWRAFRGKRRDAESGR